MSILQNAIDMATALENEGHGGRGYTANGAPPSANDPLLCHGELVAQCPGCITLNAWRTARSRHCQQCDQPSATHSETCTYDIPAEECGELVYRWDGNPAYHCIGPKGVAHSHADPDPAHMGQLLYDFHLAGSSRETVFQLTPLTDAAKIWIGANVSCNDGSFHPDWPTLVIEARYVDGLIAGIIGDMLTVKRAGQ